MFILVFYRGEFNFFIMFKDIVLRNIFLLFVVKVKLINFFFKLINILNKFMKRYEFFIVDFSFFRYVRLLFLRFFKKVKKYIRRFVNFYVNIDFIDNVNFYIGM